MQRIALGVEYAGQNYHGWQQQRDCDETIQECLESAIAQIANHPVKTICAGRTDAGVHACGQIIHCDVQVDRTEHEWVFGCNRFLPPDIRVLWVKKVEKISMRVSLLFSAITNTFYIITKFALVCCTTMFLGIFIR